MPEGLSTTARRLVGRYRVVSGKGFRLAGIDPADTAGLDLDKAGAKALLGQATEQLAALQDRLCADDRYAILLIFQAMDAAGKDSTIKHVMSG